jgi:hypothetical protein
MAILHDVYRLGASQNVAYAVAGGASAVSASFGNETYWVEVCAVGANTATSGFRIVIGDNPTFNIISGTYVSVSGLVTLTLSSPHGLSSGTTVVVSGQPVPVLTSPPSMAPKQRVPEQWGPR